MQGVDIRSCKADAEYTYVMSNDSVFEEIQDNTREAGQRLRASLNLLRHQGMTETESELVTRLTVAIAMVESSYTEARRRKEM